MYHLYLGMLACAMHEHDLWQEGAQALTANWAPSWSEMPSGTASRLASGAVRKLCQVPFPSALPRSMLYEAQHSGCMIALVDTVAV